MSANHTARGAWTVRLPGRVSFRLRRRGLGYGLASAAAALAIVAVLLLVGAYPIAPPDVADALFYGTGERLAVHFVTQERLPQAVLALLAGAAMGASGAIFQSLARNPLASPEIIGFTSGASTGAILTIAFTGGTALVAPGAITGGLATALAVYLLAYRDGNDAVRLVLVGLGVTAMLGSVNSYLLTRSDLRTAQDAHLWLIGSLNGRGWESVAILGPAAALLLTAACLLGRRLRMLELGDEAAVGLGLRPDRSRLALAVVGVALCGATVAATGPIPFIALVAPQIASRLARIPGTGPGAAALTGAVLLGAAHLVSGRIFPVAVWWSETFPALALAEPDSAAIGVPVGATCSVLGGLYLTVLLVRRWKAR
ncbi:iron chelate uptake ABC transporter family permease subunit [Glycomyces sp. NPDC046736]|uniref:FecCD family ABC transporter permease n=1 Tax=Glycomyces sp. NPDC046736 TaxID=3155615 RepID=UPI0033D28D07